MHDRDAQDVAPLELEKVNVGMVSRGINKSCASCSISNRGCGAMNGAADAAAAVDAAAALSVASDDAFEVPTVRGLSDAVVCICCGEGVPRALRCEHSAGVLPSALNLVL